MRIGTASEGGMERHFPYRRETYLTVGLRAEAQGQRAVQGPSLIPITALRPWALALRPFSLAPSDDNRDTSVARIEGGLGRPQSSVGVPAHRLDLSGLHPRSHEHAAGGVGA